MSMIVGEGLVILYYFNLLPTFGFLPVVFVMGGAFGAYLLVAFFEKRPSITVPDFLKSPYFYGFLLIFILAMDFWRWHRAPRLCFGFPNWVIYFILLSMGQTLLSWILIKKWRKKGEVFQTAGE